MERMIVTEACVQRGLNTYARDRQKLTLTKVFSVLMLLVFALGSVHILDIPIERVLGVLGPLGTMISTRLFPPDMAYALSGSILQLMVQTVEMSIVGAVIGTVIAIPLAWFGAWNVSPSRLLLYPLARLSIVLGRAVPSMMWGLILVAVLGFGPLPGIIALIVSSVGFAGKLMAEQVEAIDMKPVEAIEATGGRPIAVFLYGIVPQIKPAWAGIFIYNWDARLRSSTILGFVGAGGIGLALREQISTLNYHTAIGIILLIVLLVIVSEAISHYVRKSFL